MDPKVESKCDFDEAMVQVNGILRAVRKKCIDVNGQQPLTPLAHHVANMLNCERKPSWSLRQYAKMVQQVADGVEACEKSHPGYPCHDGYLMLQQVILPVMLSISCVAAGFELARGKDMKLEDHDA